MKTKTKPLKTHKNKNECKFCNKVIVGSSFKYKSHLYQHSVVKSRFKCSYCLKEYFRRDAYEKHLTSHTGKKKLHICDHCDRGFVEKRNLIIHLKIHDEYFTQPKSQYRCIACGTRFCEERLLKYHIRKKHFSFNETEPTYVKKNLNETWVERVMESEICVEMTKVNNNIINIKKSLTTNKEVHVKKKSETSKFNEYMSSIIASKDVSQYSKAVCDYCNKEMLKKSLLAHIRERHLKIRKFKCEDCQQSFSRHYQMVNHICGKYKRRKK